jgi:hypothetical protein
MAIDTKFLDTFGEEEEELDLSFLDQFKEEEEEEPEKDLSFLDEFAVDPIEDYNSSAYLAETMAKSREENYSRYGELYQKPDRTPQETEEMVAAWQKSHEAELGFYSEQKKLETLRPEVDRVNAERQQARVDQIESLRLDPVFGDSVADRLYEFDSALQAEMEQARAIPDRADRELAIEGIAKKYNDQETTLIKGAAESYTQRFDLSKQTASLLRQLEVNDKFAIDEYGKEVQEAFGTLPFDIPDRPEGPQLAQEAWQKAKDKQLENKVATEAEIEKLISTFPKDQQDEIRQNAQEFIAVQKGEKEVAVIQGQPVFSRDAQEDFERQKEIVSELFEDGDINDVERKASIEAIDATALADRQNKLEFFRNLPDYQKRVEGTTEEEAFEKYAEERKGVAAITMDYFSGIEQGTDGYVSMALEGQQLREALSEGNEDGAMEAAFQIINKTIEQQQQKKDPFQSGTAAMAGQVMGQVGAQITTQKGGELLIRGLSLVAGAAARSPALNQLGQQAAPWLAGGAGAVANANIYGLDWFQTTVQDFLETANVEKIDDLSDDQKKQLYKEAVGAFNASQLPSVTELVEPTMFINLPKSARKTTVGRVLSGGLNIAVETGQEKFTEEWKEAYLRNYVSAHQAQSTMGAEDLAGMALGLLPLGGAKFTVDTIRARRDTIRENKLKDLDKYNAARAEQLRAEQAAIDAAEQAAINAEGLTPESADAMKVVVEAAKDNIDVEIADSLVRLPEQEISQENQAVQEALIRIDADDRSQIFQDMARVVVSETIRPTEGLNQVTIENFKNDISYIENLINKNEFTVAELDKTQFKRFLSEERYNQFVQVVEENPQEAIRSVRELVDGFVGKLEVPVEAAGGGEEERITPAVRTIADSIRDKDTFVYEGMRGSLTEEDGQVVFREFGTQEKYEVGVQPAQTLGEIEGIQWARRGQRRQRPEEARTEIATIIEGQPTIAQEEVDTTEDQFETPAALIEIEKSQTLNDLADLFDTGESKVVQEGKRAKKVSDTPEFYRQVQPEQISQANRLIDSALRIIDALPISEDQRAAMAEPFLLLDQDISNYESNPEYQRYKSSIRTEVRPAVEAGAIPETVGEVEAGVRELEQRATAEATRLEQEAQARRVAAGQAAFVATKPVDSIARVARAEATPQEFEVLVEQGLAEEYNGQQVLTQAGFDTLPQDQRPRLTPEARKIQIDTGASEAAAEAITKGLRIGVDQVPPNIRMPEGWTLVGDVYVPPEAQAVAGRIAREEEAIKEIATQYGVDNEIATAIFNNVPFTMASWGEWGGPRDRGWMMENYGGKLYAIPPATIKKRLAAQGELRRLSILERAALAGILTEQRLLTETDAKQYIQDASNQGFSSDEIDAATATAESKWNERFGSDGNARQVAGEVSPEVVDVATEEAQRATRPRVTGGDALPASQLFGMTAREALQYLADLNLGASTLEAEGRPLNLSQQMQRAASVLAKLPLRILDADFIKKAKGGSRAYRANEGFIRIPATYRGNEYFERPETLVHEVGHTLTADALRKYVFDRSVRGARGSTYAKALDDALANPDTPEQVKKIVSLYKQTLDELGLTQEYLGAGGLADIDATRSQKKAFTRKKPLINKFTGKKIGWSELYALANLDEFVAQTWSSPAFQDMLKNIKVKNKPSIYERFVRIIRDLFGFDSDTMATAVIDASYALAELEAPATGGTVDQRIAGNLQRGRGVTTPPPAPTEEPITQQDREYLDAVDRGDAETQQRIVNEAARRGGYQVLPLFHGTEASVINRFRKKLTGIWLAFDKKMATPSSGEYPTTVINAYADLGSNPITLNPEQVKEWQNSGKPKDWIRIFRERNRATAIIIGDYATVVFKPSQVKSADAITRDNRGNIIPPSQRFQPTEEDIRYAPLPEPPPDPETNEEVSNETTEAIVTNRAEAKKAQELVTGHSILPDEVPSELREEAQANYQNGMTLGDFLNPQFFNLGEAYNPYIAATWLELNGGLMPTVKVEGKEIAKPEKGTSESEALRLLKRAFDILDSRSETAGGKELTYSLQDIMATWMESGLGPAALKNAIVQFTNLDVAQAEKTANDFANVYQLAQNVTSTKERARVRMDRALPAMTARQQREKERMIKLEEATGSIDSIAEAIRIAYDIGVKKPKTDKATEKKQIEEQLRQAKQILREVVPKQYLGDQLLTLERATGLEGLKKVVEAAQNGLNQARLDEAVTGAKKSLDRAQKAVKANEISPEAMAVLRDFVETYSKKGIGPETRAKIEDAISRYEADPVGALQDLATEKYLKQKGALGAIKIDKSLGLDALKEISRIINTTLHADKVARGEMLFNKQETRQEVITGISEEIDKVKSIAKARKDGGQGIGLFNKIAIYKGARVENILRAFGLNKLSEFVYDRLTLDAYQDELRVRRDLKKKIESRVKEITGLEIGTKDYDLYSKEVIELTGVDSAGRTKPIKVRRYELLDILASMRDPSNLKRAVNSGGYVIDRLDLAEVDTVKITPETYIEILNKATDQDNQMVDMMVELYNNDLFQILENASVQAYGHGIKAVSGTYYPRTADKWTRATEVKKDLDYIAYYQRRVDDVGYLKERDERSKSKLRAVDFLERLDYHVTNDARIGAYLPIVRDIEMVLGDPTIARPLASKIGEDGLTMIREMVRQQTTPPAGLKAGILSTLIGNAGVGVLGFKLHAAMQNPVGLPIALAYYGKDGVKYLAKAFPAGIRATKKGDRIEMEKILSQYAPYYNERYGDGGFIQEFTSGLSAAPSNRKWRKNLETASMSWLEASDKWGALVRYKLAQQVVQDRTTLESGTEEFNRAVAREWTKMMFRSENTAHGGDRTGVFQDVGRNPALKLFVMFQSAVSKQYSLFAEAMLRAQQGGKENLREAAFQLGFLSLSLYISRAISNAFYSTLFPPEDDEEKTWGQFLGKAIGTPLSIVPVVGSFLQNTTEAIFSPENMRKPMQIDLVSSVLFGMYDVSLLFARAYGELSEEKIDEATGNPKFWETSYRAITKAGGLAGVYFGIPIGGVVQTAQFGLRLKERVGDVFSGEPKTEDFQKKIKEYEKEQRTEPVTQEYAKIFFAVTEDNQKEFNRALKDLKAKRPDLSRKDVINAIRRRPEFRVVGMVRSGKIKQKDLEANGISRDYYLTQKALLRATEEAAKMMYRDSKD